MIGRNIDIAIQTSGGAIIERMGQRKFRMNPGQAKSFERERIEKRRTGGQGMNSGTNVVYKIRQRQLSGSCTAANRGIRFANKNGTTRTSKRNGCSQTVRARSYYYCIVLIRHESRDQKIAPIFPA